MSMKDYFNSFELDFINRGLHRSMDTEETLHYSFKAGYAYGRDDSSAEIKKLKECLFQTQEASKDLAVMNQNQRIYFDENVELKKKLGIAFDELQDIATGMRHGKERESALKALTQLSER